MRQNGQNIGEYGIAFGLIVIVCIGVVGMIGTNVSGLFSSTISYQSDSRTPETTGGTGVPSGAEATIAGTPFSLLPGQQITVDLGNGKSLALNMADPVAVAEAAGGNGVTENALVVLKQVIAQLKEQGEDESQIAELEKLAEKGQKIKSLQQQIESRFPKNGFTSDEERYQFLDNPANRIVLDGRKITLLEASGSLTTGIVGMKKPSAYKAKNYDSFNSGSDTSETRFTSSTVVNFKKASYDKYFDTYDNQPGLLNDFMAQLQKVENTALLANPILKNLIKDDLSRQIFMSSTQTFQVPTREEVGTLVKITRTSSNDICTLSNSVTCQDRPG